MPTQVIITYDATPADAKYSPVNIPIKFTSFAYRHRVEGNFEISFAAYFCIKFILCLFWEIRYTYIILLNM